MITPTLKSAVTSASIGYGNHQDCGPEQPLISTQSQSLIRSSVDYQVDDSHAPDYFLVTVTYGMYYQPEGWSYKKYTLKLQANAQGDLHYERVHGSDENIVSADTHAQAGPFVMYSNSYRLYFYCRTRYVKDRQTHEFQDMKSLCLGVG